MTKTDAEGLPSFWEAVSGGRAEARRRRLERRDRRMARLYALLAVALVVCGTTAICVPPLNQWLNDGRLTASARAAEATAAVQTDADRALEAAEAYNRRLAAQQVQIGEVVRPDGTRDADFKDDTEYQGLLRLDAAGAMGVLSVPAIGVELPIRHGTGSDVLDDGLGHVHGTSLPVGGRSTRTVISGHTNMEGRTLFTRLDELKRGQTFTISTYGRVLHYRIVDIRVTSPSDTEALGIRPGRDLATLLTCTDTGNTRRLLVTGERYTPSGPGAGQADMRAARDGALACGGAVALAGLAVARRDRERLCRHTADAFRPGERRS